MTYELKIDEDSADNLVRELLKEAIENHLRWPWYGDPKKDKKDLKALVRVYNMHVPPNKALKLKDLET